ncbi:MAG: hypothetical protein WB816_07890 [Methylocystis sp.]
MSQMFVTEFNESDASIQHDLLARLYREIGLSAVAAALEVMDASEKRNDARNADPRQLPAFLREEDIAA